MTAPISVKRLAARYLTFAPGRWWPCTGGPNSSKARTAHRGGPMAAQEDLHREPTLLAAGVSRLPQGVRLEIEAHAVTASLIVWWPIAVKIDNEADCCEVRDVTSLLAAMVALGLPEHYLAEPLDLMAVLLEPVTFGPVNPVVSDRLRARAHLEDVAPADRLALDLYVSAALGRWTPPTWLAEHLKALALSEAADLPAKARSTNPSRAGRSI